MDERWLLGQSLLTSSRNFVRTVSAQLSFPVEGEKMLLAKLLRARLFPPPFLFIFFLSFSLGHFSSPLPSSRGRRRRRRRRRRWAKGTFRSFSRSDHSDLWLAALSVTSLRFFYPGLPAGRRKKSPRPGKRVRVPRRTRSFSPGCTIVRLLRWFLRYAAVNERTGVDASASCVFANRGHFDILD